MQEITRKKIAFHNLGCKVNAYETEAMQQQMEAAGYETVPFEPGADLYVINTCSVTNMADRKSRQMLHKAKKMNPDALVIAAGCYVQTATEKTGLAVEADIILGNNRKQSLLDAVLEYEREQMEAEGKTWKDIIDINHTKEYEKLEIEKTQEHTRAYIKVQDGCNQFCSYCIIPYARGRARSRQMDDILSELKKVTENGVKEVVLTGIHLSSYGLDIGSDLLTLIRNVHELEGIERIRLGSLEPGIITEEFAAAVAGLDKFCPHFHLSLQSGCDSVLQRMNRKYTTEEYLEKCRILRQHFEEPALTTDVICGFPGETQEEFEQTVEFLKKVRFYETHIFKYSMRKGTRAAQMKDQVPEPEKAKRSDILLELNEIHKAAYESYWNGKACEVLFEEPMDLEDGSYFTGYTKNYIKTWIKTDQDYENCSVRGILSIDPKDPQHPKLLQN